MTGERLAQRAERGEPRGAGQVWAAATRQLTAEPDPAGGRRRWLAVLGAAAATVAAVGAGQAFLGAGGGDSGATDQVPTPTEPTPAVQPTPTASPTAAATRTPTDSLPVAGGAALDEAYLQCARDRGFDPGFVQVLVVDGRADWVKTGRDVPAEVHRPCLMAIGGPDPLTSSSGYPAPLGECAGVDREPPIDWSPPPAPEDDAGTVVGSVSGSTAPGGVVPVVVAVAGRLSAPVDARVECWNGQDWTTAYLALGLGAPGTARAVEEGQGVELSDGRVELQESTMYVAVPAAAPEGTYRLVDTVTVCDKGCAETPLTVRFRVG